jgi:hypothetical protein
MWLLSLAPKGAAGMLVGCSHIFIYIIITTTTIIIFFFLITIIFNFSSF